MSEKIYGFKDDKCKAEVPSKEEFNQLESKTKDIAVITGNMTLDANTSEQALDNKVMITSKTINYPEGFNADNCVVISYGRKDNDNLGLAFGWSNYITSSEMLRGVQPMNVQLYGESTTEFANKILLQMGNLNTSEKSVIYKIVLMKINEEAE